MVYLAMGAFSDFDELYQDFTQDPFFQDAYFDIEWKEQGSGIFNPITGETTSAGETHTAKAFALSSGRISRKPQSGLFEEIKITDVFALTRNSDLKQPPINSNITFKGLEYTLIQVLRDPLDLTYMMQLRV